MSDYYKKRVEYINNWPGSDPFEAELRYKNKCDEFKEKNGRLPFAPMKMWESNDDDYNRSLSNIIESLESLPYKPNHAFNFLFMAFDYYSKKQYKDTRTTVNIKIFADKIMNEPSNNNQTIINNILKELFDNIPFSTCSYFSIRLMKNSQVETRVTTAEKNDKNYPVQAYHDLVGFIINKYDCRVYEDRRKASSLCRRIFIKDTIKTDSGVVNIDNKLRLQFLLSGIIYTSRNDYLHGSSMAPTKSSTTSLETYASNYYCFLSLYTLLMLLLIENSFSDENKKESYYSDLLNVVKVNISDYNELFKGHTK